MKIKAIQIIGLVPFLLLIVLLGILWWITGNTIVFYVWALFILIAMYFTTHLFFDNLFSFGEKNMVDDEELLKLEINEASLYWGFLGGAGFSFLTAGLATFAQNPLPAFIGFIFLILGNLIFNILYYPRQRLLIRKRLVEIALSKRHKERTKDIKS